MTVSKPSITPDVPKAVELLDECLNDEVAWEPEELVERMEDVREALTGDRVSPDA